MFRTSILVALCAVALSSPVQVFKPELDGEWLAYKQEHNKAYTQTEELYRRVIWEHNIDYIQRHNLEADRGLHTFWLGMNEYGDMTSEEFVRVMNGFIMSNKTSSDNLYMPPSHVGDPPASVDWRTKGYVTEVKNQKQCGSCWAFSTTGSLEGQTFKKKGTLTSLSEQNLVDCSKKEGNKGCQGGLMDQAFKYIKINNGIDTEESYPYKGKNGKCHFEASNVGATDTGYTDIKKGSESDLQSAVATIGPISVAMDASHPSFQMYKRGVYSERRCSSKKLDHGVLAVGYGGDGSQAYWIVKNSWGKTWGMEGYFEMARNKDNMCGIATQASYPLV